MLQNAKQRIQFNQHCSKSELIVRQQSFELVNQTSTCDLKQLRSRPFSEIRWKPQKWKQLVSNLFFSSETFHDLFRCLDTKTYLLLWADIFVRHRLITIENFDYKNWLGIRIVALDEAQRLALVTPEKRTGFDPISLPLKFFTHGKNLTI